MPIKKHDAERIAAAVASAEQRTSGEIVCVLARSSSRYGHAPLLWAAALALSAPALLLALTQLSAQAIYLIQIGVFFAAAGLMSLPILRYALVPRAAKRARAHRAALEQFFARRVSRTRDRNGVLIYVSLAERYARIVADDGIAAKVDQDVWQAAVDALVACMRQRRVGDGFVATIESCGATLASHFPGDGANPNELPDKLIVL